MHYSREREYVHVLYKLTQVLRKTIAELNILLRQNKVEPTMIKYLGSNLQRALEVALWHFRRLGIEKEGGTAPNNPDPNRVLTCAKNDQHTGASRFISIVMGVLQQMDRAIDKVDRDPVGLVWKTVDNLASTLKSYDMSVRFYTKNSNLEQCRDRALAKLGKDMEKVMAVLLKHVRNLKHF